MDGAAGVCCCGRCCCRGLDGEERSGKMAMQTARWYSEGELIWLLSGVLLVGGGVAVSGDES